ncbi:hypothetical protein ZIOFF_020078 [Zingiber officinale]|uniref:RPA-interacting protein n=1 Tax=Zingiber officinale TaxID=94328 RepID=A0A8J5HAN7_ZINOF|nr:hypothetical protein ZIOFF_020078 [Zingiber officinale]
MDGGRRRRAAIKSLHPDWKEKSETAKSTVALENEVKCTTISWGKAFPIIEFPSFCWQNIMESTLRDIVSHELQKIKQSSSHENQRNLTSYNNDFVWEFDGLNEEISTEIESEDLMLEMQKLLYEDLREEYIRRELEFFEEEDKYLAEAVLDHMNLSDDQISENSKVWCPICKKGELRENYQLVYCTHCSLRLDPGNDKINLDFLKVRLGEVHLEHLNRGCRAAPKFLMHNMFNLNALFIQCEACDTFEIVM